jgi:hypothetical protein
MGRTNRFDKFEGSKKYSNGRKDKKVRVKTDSKDWTKRSGNRKLQEEKYEGN